MQSCFLSAPAGAAMLFGGLRPRQAKPVFPQRAARLRPVVAAASGQEAQARPAVDDFKESSRQFLRTVFDVDRWETHRSTARYARHIFGLPESRLVRNLADPLLYVIGIATAVAAYESARTTGYLPDLPDITLKSKEIFGLSSFALSLLLVFRTNSSYGRWDEARKMWGLMLNRSRDIARQGLAWIPEDRPELRDMLCRWVPAFSKTLMCHLRKGDDLVKELETVGLQPHEIAAVMRATHRPNYVLQVLGQIVREARLPTAPTITMEGNITTFEDVLGGCERILRTPIPLMYTRHTSRFMMIWLTLLPFSLVSTTGWGTVPLCGIIAFLLLGIEEIGVSIEEPFSILSLEAISNTALVNIRELQATHDNGSPGSEDDVSAINMIRLAEEAHRNSNGSSGMAGAGLNGARELTRV